MYVIALDKKVVGRALRYCFCLLASMYQNRPGKLLENFVIMLESCPLHFSDYPWHFGFR